MTLIVKTEQEICEIYHVTPEQIDKASRIIDMSTGKVFYQVKSQSDPTQEPYEVRYNAQYKRLTCTCLAGQSGFGCWHRRAALAAMYEYRQQENIQARIEAGDGEAREAARWLAHRKSFDRDMRKLEAQREANARVEGFHLLK